MSSDSYCSNANAPGLTTVGVARVDGHQLWFLNLPVVNQVPSPGCWADIDGNGKDDAVAEPGVGIHCGGYR